MTKPAEWVIEARRLFDEEKLPLNEIARKLGKSVSMVLTKAGPNRDAYGFRDLGAAMYRQFGFDHKPTVAEAEEFIRQNPDFMKDFEMSDRQFQAVSVFENGKRHSALRIECSKKVSDDCKLHEEFYNKTGNSTSVVHAASVFRAHGWIVGGGPRADICGACYKFINDKRREEAMAKKMSGATIITEAVGGKPVSVMTNVPKPAIPVSQLTLKDVDKTAKRLIDDKLDEVYDASKGGYLNGYGDEKVASELNTMVEWVALVRDFGHGPNTSNADISEDVKAVDRSLKEVMEAKRLVDAGVERMAELDKALNARLADFEKKAADFQTLYNQVKAKLGNLL